MDPYSKPQYGGFPKWWYSQMIHFNRVFHYKPSILWYPHFWKHQYHSLALPNLGYITLASLFFLRSSHLRISSYHTVGSKQDSRVMEIWSSPCKQGCFTPILLYYDMLLKKIKSYVIYLPFYISSWKGRQPEKTSNGGSSGCECKQASKSKHQTSCRQPPNI